MPEVAAVRLAFNPKVLWFDPAGVEFAKGDKLIVSTERGLEFGTADANVLEVSQEEIDGLNSPLKPVIRVAGEEDCQEWERLCDLSAEALPTFKRLVAESGLDMRPVAVEYLFDGDKAVFYFESEDRVDFRNLVRTLASQFHVRVDMRQIGVRDEARIVGGLGHCGLELCCRRLGGRFNPVSIRMAKDQDLSLNPQKISGVCGRLMCCLRYENDTYKEFKTRCPKMNAKVNTPEGEAKVVEVSVPRETVTILTADNKRVKVPVSDMTVEKEGGNGKPDTVPSDVYYDCLNADSPSNSVGALFVDTIFTGQDALVSNPRANHTGSRTQSTVEDEGESDEKKTSRRRRSRSRSRAQSASEQAAQPKQGAKQKPKQDGKQKQQGQKQGQGKQQSKQRRQQAGANAGQPQRSKQDAPKPRRRHVTDASGATTVSQPRQQAERGAQKPAGGARPGHRSSGLSDAGKQAQAPAQQTEHRRSRRRTHKTQGGEGGE